MTTCLHDVTCRGGRHRAKSVHGYCKVRERERVRECKEQLNMNNEGIFRKYKTPQ